MVAPNNDSVEYQIILQAAKAMQDLQALTAQATSFNEKVMMVTASLKQFSAQSGLTMKATISLFQDADKEFAKLTDRSALFGDLQKQGWQEVGQAAETNTKKAVHGIDAVRIALGALVAMLIFNVIATIQNAFRELIHNIKEAELAVYNLINAERRLSEEGIDVTPKGLQEIIDSIQKLVPVISQIQSEELVSRIATNVAPALRLTNEQIKQMAESVALLYVRNKALGKSFDEVESQLTNAFLTGKVSQGINNLGVKISDQIVRDEALRMGLVKTEDEFNNLSGEVEAHIKAVAMLSVVYKNAQQDVGSISEYMKTVDAQSSRTSKAWSDFLTTFGKIFGPSMAQGLEVIAHGLEIITKLLEAMKGPLQIIVALTVAWVETLRNLPQYLKLGGGSLFGANFKKNFEETMQLFKGLEDAVDTPTAALNELGEAAENVDFSKLKQKIEDIIRDTAEARSDLEKKMGEKLADLDVEYQRKALDAQRDYFRKVEDINRDYERDLAELRKKQREEDKRDEEKYQLALWELRMRYLMDLEEALHARDARQILRLQKQYAIDKEALARKHALDGKQREEDQRAELEDAKLKRDRRLEDAKLEYEQRLADQRVAKQRELEDLNTWYAREQADIELAQQRKLQTLLKGWMDEQKITEANAATVYGILLKYFGPGGMTDALYKYMMDSLIANTQAATAGLMGQMSMSPAGGGSVGGRPGGGGSGTGNRLPRAGTIGGRAEGGTLVATRPTSVTFGEKGAEAAVFLPMSRIGRDSGRVDFSGNAGGGMDGRIVVRLDLSPDLEARVVENSMNGVADVITQINRSKF